MNSNIGIKMSNYSVNPDFLTPKKKQQNVTGEKAIEEHCSYESSDSIKEIKHHIAEARIKTVKEINLNPRTKYQVSIPNWAVLLVTQE